MDINRFTDTLLQVARNLAPYDTGNLRNNGITNLSTTLTEGTFSLNERDDAPYGVILNEAPVINYAGHVRRVNVHYRWFTSAIEYGVALAAGEIGAEVEF